MIIGPSKRMVPSHIRIVSTQEWCRMNFPSFIDKDHWPPNSPDLNPLDYSIWDEFAQQINWAKVKSKKTLIDELKRSVKRIRDSCWKVVKVGPIVCIVCLKTKEIIYINENRYFCRELKDDSLRKKFRSLAQKLREIILKQKVAILCS